MAAITLRTVSQASGRDASDLTRRDVARALLSAPAAQVIADLPGLRRELVAAENPMSPSFWASAESLLTSIAEQVATVGDVHRWLEATGTEPTDMVADLFVWPEEEERGPVAQEMHARLVAHLEDSVAAGLIDPDRLLAGDEEALAVYREIQRAWLYEPLEDGRQPIIAVDDEDTEELLAAWDEAEKDARLILSELLDDIGDRPCPEDELQRVCARLRRELPTGTWPYDLLSAAGGVDPQALPDSDRELWLTLASGAVLCREEPPDAELGYPEWISLEFPDWIGAVVSLARAGPGAYVDADTLAHWAATFDFGDDDTAGDLADLSLDPDLEELEWDDLDIESSLRVGFGVVTLLWLVLGAVDGDERLTELGWWGLPEALLDAWAPRPDPT